MMFGYLKRKEEIDRLERRCDHLEGQIEMLDLREEALREWLVTKGAAEREYIGKKFVVPLVRPELGDAPLFTCTPVSGGITRDEAIEFLLKKADVQMVSAKKAELV